MNPQIFLSASIPIPGRPPFDDDVQIKRIRDAVLALVTICKDRHMQLVFGGHPAISPLVHHAAESLGVIENICIYQSEFYENRMPEAAKKFPRLEMIRMGRNQQHSEELMRGQMLDPQRWQYQFAFFVGGMEGIITEAAMFCDRYPGVPMVPLRETGGAARRLEWSAEPDGRHTFPLVFLDSQKENAATSAMRYRRLLNDFIGGH